MKKEGQYTLQRVSKLPKRGNANWLYFLTTEDPVKAFYEWNSNGTYEAIDIGAVSIDILSFPVENIYVDSSNMLGDQSNQTIKFFQYVEDIDTYYEYLGTTTENIKDYRKLTADEVTIINNRGVRPVHRNYANLATMYTTASQRKQRKGWLYRVDSDNSHYEYLGTRNGDSTDYIKVGGTGGAASTGLEAINEGNGIGHRLIGKNAANYGNIGFNAVDFSANVSASSVFGARGEECFAGTGGNLRLEGYNQVGFGYDNNILEGAFGAGSLVSGYNNNIYEYNYTSFNFGFYNKLGTAGSTGGANPINWYSGTMGYFNNIYGGRGTYGFGAGLLGGSAYTTIVGAANVDKTVSTANQTWNLSNTTANPAFIVGIGDVNSSNPTAPTFTRKNGLEVYRSGLAVLPSTSNTQIDAEPTGKAVLTREWVQNNSPISIKVILTPAQIKTLNSVPVQIIPSPGAGKYIRIHSADAFLTWNSVAYTNFYPEIKTVGAVDRQLGFPSFFNKTTNWNVQEKSDSGTQRYVENAAVEVYGDSDSAVGDSNVTFYITYSIVTL